jgi:cobalt-precorrin-5B (C1)-methyltransferase
MTGTGFTTGTAAAAAAKGAMLNLLEGRPPSDVRICLLNGDKIRIPIHSSRIENSRTAICTVIKDAGDDPDVTHGAEIGARVTVMSHRQGDGIEIDAGLGVGTVTKPGLEVSPGEPAINPGPRKMIIASVRRVLKGAHQKMPVKVEIFAPEGEALAKKTLNARLGIIGGLSILGTTGVVKPLSHDTYIATIAAALSVARAAGLDRIVLTTGRRSERFAQAAWVELPGEAFVQIGDFFKRSMEMASARGFGAITLSVFFGKAIKMAQGIDHTHARKSRLTLDRLGAWIIEVTGDAVFAKTVQNANTARQALALLIPKYPQVIAYVGRRIVHAASGFLQTDVHVRSVIFDYQGAVLFDSDGKMETDVFVDA